MSLIYKTTNLITNKIYIGQHNGNNCYYLGSGIHIARSIKKHGRENFKRETIVEGDFNQELLNELERHYIQLYNCTNKDIGYNIGLGGDHRGRYSEETRKKLSESLKVSWNKKSSEAQSNHLARLYKDIVVSRDRVAKKLAVPVNQLDKDTLEIIQTWWSRTEAAKNLNLNAPSITMCCKGRRNYCGGFKWEYANKS